MNSIERQVVQQLEGGRAKTDIELQSALAVSRHEIEQAAGHLKEQQVIRVLSKPEDPETIYTLQERSSGEELRIKPFVEKLRSSNWIP